MANSPVYRVRKEKLSRRVSTSFDRQFLQCWKGQAKPTAFSKMKLVFRLHLAEDGSLQRKPELIGSKGVERDWQSIRDAIVKAFAECQPYDLPGRLYGQWHVLMVDVTQKGAKSH